LIYRTNTEIATTGTMADRLIARQLLLRLAPALLLGIAAFALVLAVTDPPGPGLDPDALSYFGAAESLVAHGEYRIPTAAWTSADSTSSLAHFPPGYSTALAIPAALGMAPPQAARLVDALAAGVTIATLALLVGAATPPITGALLALALLAMPAMAEVHLSALSEPLFLALLALTLAAMVRVPDRPLRAGIPAALASTVRYAGAALVGAVVLWQLARRSPLRERVRRAVVASLPALVLQGVWVVRTRLAAGGAGAIREFALYGDLGPTLREGGATLRDWLVPNPATDADTGAAVAMPYHGWIALAAGVVLVALVVAGARRARAEARGSAQHVGRADGGDIRDIGAERALAWRLLRACALLLVCYSAMIVVSRLIADAAIPFDNRILSPFLLLAATGVATAIGCWWQGTRSVSARIVVVVALLGWWTASAGVTHDDASFALDHGSDFAGEEWRRSPVLEWARTEGASHPLYTNWPAAVYFHLHRPSRELPARDETDALAAFVDTLRRRDGRVLMFGAESPGQVTPTMLMAQHGLRVVVRLDDGVVLAPAP
jgi:hypothetical protein